MLIRHELGDGWVGRTSLPPALPVDFDAMWALHPDDYHRISIMGREQPVPRWSQAYGTAYRYSGRLDAALPVPELLHDVVHWARETIEPGLNGVLVNWYDAALGHYIGKHRDSTKGLVKGSSIVSISLGATRVFRIRPWRERGFTDLQIGDRSVVVLPWDTNQRYTHEVPLHSCDEGRRISVTLRAFDPAGCSAEGAHP